MAKDTTEETKINQLASEITVCDTAQSERLPKWQSWMKLYKNSRRDKDAIGDNLLYSIINTLLSSIQNDKMTVEFKGIEYGDTEAAEQLNITAEYDYDKMNKYDLDHDWNWNSLFFGTGLCLMREFDTKEKIPVPDLFDPLTTYIDPRATTINGKGGARFFGRAIALTKREAESMGYENLDELDAGSRSQDLEDAQEARDEAFGITYQKDDVEGENKTYHFMEWYTFYGGKRTFFVTNIEVTTIHKEKELPNQKAWDIVKRTPSPIAGDFYGVSICDLVEDKQRGNANLKNLMLQAAELDVYKMFMYDSNKVPEGSDLDVRQGGGIAVDGPVGDAIRPIETQGIAQSAQFMVEMMTGDAEKAAATPEVKQGAQLQKVKSAAEINTVSQGSDTRYGLILKNIERSEKEFWRDWYLLYKTFFKKGLGDKYVRLSGAFDTEYRKITSEAIKMKYDPDITIVSRSENAAENAQKVTALSFLISNNQEIDAREVSKEILLASGMSTADVRRIVPPTVDELVAEEQNKKLSEGKDVAVAATDDHNVFIRINSKAADTPARNKKIQKHKEFLTLNKTRPDLVPGVPNPPLPGEETEFQPTAPIQPQPLAPGQLA